MRLQIDPQDSLEDLLLAKQVIEQWIARKQVVPQLPLSPDKPIPPAPQSAELPQTLPKIEWY